MPLCSRFASPANPIGAIALGVVVLVAVGGCSSSPEAPKNGTNTETPPLKLLVIDDPELAAAVEREWKARNPGELKVATGAWKEIAGQPRLDADLVIYPLEHFGELAAADLLAPLLQELLADDGLAWRDVLELSRRAETQWDRKTYALPLASAQLVLLYRADLFAKLELKPPTTWAEYQAAAEKLRDPVALSDLALKPAANWSAVAEPLAPGWAGLTLLARAASYAKPTGQYSTVFNFASMKPLIDGPPFVQALEELVAASKAGPSDLFAISPDETRRSLLAGECAMALTWPRRDAGPAAGLIAAAELPGSPRVYDGGEKKWITRNADDPPCVPLIAVAGRFGSVTSSTSHREAAARALALIVGRDWSRQIGPATAAAGVVRYSELDELGPWLPAGSDAALVSSYRETIKTRNQNGVSFLPPQLPGRERYLASLDEAVHKAVRGDAKPAEALAGAAEAWQKITAELGLEAQKTAYCRSLGIP